MQPGVPVYQAYPRTLLALNGLPTMQQRIGNRYWRAGNPAGVEPATARVPPAAREDRRAWARVEAAKATSSPTRRPATADCDLDIWKLQVGIDRPVREMRRRHAGRRRHLHYGTADTNVAVAIGDGSIATEGYGFGGSLTWLGSDGVYVDGQAQLTWYDSDLSLRTLVDDDLASGNDGFGYALGVEAGKRIPLSDDWTVTPQGQLVYSSVDFDDFTDIFDADVACETAATACRLRLGVASTRSGHGVDDRRRRARARISTASPTSYYDFIDGTGVDVVGHRASTPTTTASGARSGSAAPTAGTTAPTRSTARAWSPPASPTSRTTTPTAPPSASAWPGRRPRGAGDHRAAAAAGSKVIATPLMQ